MDDTERKSRVPEPLAHFLARELARAIELGEYKPGQRMGEAEIAARYGVSRAPVREALRMLTRDELVVQRPRRGTVVVHLSPAEISEMFELRSALYAAVVRLFVRRALPGELQAYLPFVRRIEVLADDPSVTPAQFVESTQAASAFLLAHCGNGRLQKAFRKLTSQSYRYYAMMAHSTIAHRKLLVGFAKDMLAAIMAGEAERASDLAWRLHESNHAAALAAIAARPGDEPQ
ncbi:MAG: GntR family transcriptional regulator [Hyphomicrobiales bacterium]|nr:GntR family transcriptional regulator [Hyphomicrobiales bacterium]